MPPLFDSSPTSLLTNFPKTKALVRAGVVAVGVASAASIAGACAGDEDIAPTCGICCHMPDDPSCDDAGGGDADAGLEADAGQNDAGLSDAGPVDAGPIDAGIPVGPTCGPCCHGGEGCDGGF